MCRYRTYCSYSSGVNSDHARVSVIIVYGIKVIPVALLLFSRGWLNEAPQTRASKTFWAQNTDETVTRLYLGGRPNGALLEKTERKLKSPLRAPRITDQPRSHGSSARYIRDPMTHGYRPGGAYRPFGTIPRKSSRSPRPFLVVSHHTIWTHGHNPSNTSFDPWSPGQLGAGRLHYRLVCIYVVHGKQSRSSSTTNWHLSCGNVFSLVLWRPKPGLRFLYSYSSRNSSRCFPLLSLTSPPRPRFCAEDLPKSCWSILRRGQPSTCY